MTVEDWFSAVFLCSVAPTVTRRFRILLCETANDATARQPRCWSAFQPWSGGPSSPTKAVISKPSVDDLLALTKDGCKIKLIMFSLAI